MISLGLDAASLSRVRLTPSPVAEVLSWLDLTANGGRHPAFGDPGPAARWALRDRDTALVASALSRDASYRPDLLTPKPPAGRGARVLREQLDAVAATPRAVAAEQTALFTTPGRVPPELRRAVESGSFARRAARGLRMFWQACLADQWPALQTLVESDLAARAGALGRAGLGQLLNGLHPAVFWSGSQLEVYLPYQEHNELRDRELVLAPAVLGWPSMTAQLCNPDDAVLRYPALGVRGRRLAPTPAPVGSLLGGSRAALLRDLAPGRTTRELTARHDLAAATVSYHLGVLLRAGLVQRTRHGRWVQYRRTPLGDALLDHEPGAAFAR